MAPMKFFSDRRALLSAGAGAALAVWLPARAQNQAENGAEHVLASGNFKLISPFPPGGPVDILARMVADGLAARYHKTAIVENAAGAAGNIGMERVKRARADAHVLLVIPAGNLTINPTLMPGFPFDVLRDFTPVTMLAKAPNVLVTAPSSGIKTLRQLITQAKARPGALAFASPGFGSGLHLAGIDLLHVPYKGTGPALTDVLGGQVPLMFSNLPATLPFIRSGKLMALGVTEAQRTALVPDVPTFAEQGVPGVTVTSWYGLLAPAGVSPEVASQLARDAARIIDSTRLKAEIISQGMVPNLMTPAQFATYIRSETATWAQVIKARGIHAS